MTHGQLGPVSGAQPGKIGDIAQATLVLVQFEHKMITRKPLREPSRYGSAHVPAAVVACGSLLRDAGRGVGIAGGPDRLDVASLLGARAGSIVVLAAAHCIDPGRRQTGGGSCASTRPTTISTGLTGRWTALPR